MKARQVFEIALIELSKVQAPTLKLFEFNYLLNKAITQFINKVYNIYEINQQTTDDLRVLSTNAELVPKLINSSIKGDMNTIYEVIFPSDYLHLLNCICIYKIKDNLKYKCYHSGDIIKHYAKKMTSDARPMIMEDYYNKPKYNNPYFQIMENNIIPALEIKPIDIQIEDNFVPLAKCIIECGKLPELMELILTNIQYLKTPEKINLTQEQIDLIEDTSQNLEFPDYVCQEIINELVHLVMEKLEDPRLNNNLLMTQSIARPTGQL